MNKLSVWHCPIYVISITITSLLQVVVIGMSTWLFGRVVDQIENMDGKRIFVGIGMYITLELFVLIINYMCEMVEYRILQNMGNAVRKGLFVSILNQKMVVGEMQKKEYYVSMLVQDMKRYSNEYLMNQLTLISLLLRLGTFTMLLFWYHWAIGSVSLFCMVGVYWGTKWHDSKVEIFSEQKLEKDEKYLECYSDEIEGFSEYKHAGKESLFLKRLKRANLEIEKGHYAYEKKMQQVFVVQSFIKKSAHAITIALAFCLGLEGKISVGVIMASYSLFSLLWDDIGEVLPVLQNIRAIMPILNKLKVELIKPTIMTSEFDNIEGFQQIRLQHISFAYPQQKKILNKVNLTIECGKKYALMGPSGSGKTTLLRILLGLEKNYDGEILVDGKSLLRYESTMLSSAIYITQNAYLFQDSIRNNIFFGNNEWEENLRKTEYYEFLLKQLGNFDKVLENDGENISGGQRQMITVARAIASGKKFFVFDESFSAIDEATFLGIWNILNRLEDITCLLVTHRVEQAEQCYQIIRMEEIGGVVEC